MSGDVPAPDRPPRAAICVSFERSHEGLKKIFKTAQGQILLFPGSGTGAWECCIVNTLSPGEQVLGCVNGHFSDLFCRTATAHGSNVQRLEVEYGAGVPAGAIEERLRRDKERQIKAVLVVQTETSTGSPAIFADIRNAIDAAAHPALLLADVVSSLGCTDMRFDEWRLDVALTAPQKGLMLPPGMALLAVSDKALQANRSAKCARSFWDWRAGFGKQRQRPLSLHSGNRIVIRLERESQNALRRRSRQCFSPPCAAGRSLSPRR